MTSYQQFIVHCCIVINTNHCASTVQFRGDRLALSPGACITTVSPYWECGACVITNTCDDVKWSNSGYPA